MHAKLQYPIKKSYFNQTILKNSENFVTMKQLPNLGGIEYSRITDMHRVYKINT